MKKKALILGSLLLAATTSAKEIVATPVVIEEVIVEEIVVVPEITKWNLRTGVRHIERQQGRMEDAGYNTGLPDDLGEDGDVTTFFTNLKYNINEKWAMDYTYKYDYIRNDEAFGKNSNGSHADKDTGQLISHTVRALRKFDDFSFAGKNWSSGAYVGVRKYWESSIEDSGNSSDYNYNYEGFDSDRILAGANMGTQLSDKTALNLSYDYQYRQYNNDSGYDWENQHRHWVGSVIEHNFNKSLYFIFSNTLYLRQDVSETRNYGEWDPTYTLGHKYPLGNGYVLYTELTYWAEVPIWEAGNRETSEDNQSEIIFMPRIRKNFYLNNDMSIDAFIGAGYVYGLEAQRDEKQYAGFEGRTGVTFNYKF